MTVYIPKFHPLFRPVGVPIDRDRIPSVVVQPKFDTRGKEFLVALHCTSNKVAGVFPKDQVPKEMAKPIVLVALMIEEMPHLVMVFERAEQGRERGQSLFLSGRFNVADMVNGEIDQPVSAGLVTAVAAREIGEELGLKLAAVNTILTHRATRIFSPYDLVDKIAPATRAWSGRFFPVVGVIPRKLFDQITTDDSIATIRLVHYMSWREGVNKETFNGNIGLFEILRLYWRLPSFCR